MVQTLLFITTMQHPEVLVYGNFSKNFFNNYSSCGFTDENRVNLVSDHIPIHKKPVKDEEFAFYLAGLIEGDGSIKNKAINITIAFHLNDAPLAYYIKKRIGYGVIDKLKNKNALIYRANLEGSIVIAKLINGILW